jgi:DNA-directed RNA polymerase subunit M/transcription elongation factor TFIIS
MHTNGTDDDAKASNIIHLHPGKQEARTYQRTIIDNSRRYRQDQCQHKGPYIVDRKLAVVECGDCGAYLNPMYVLEMLAYKEAYWNKRQEELTQYIEAVNEEIKERTRTRCTHCGNMTAIKLKHGMPQTWVPSPY